MSFVRLIAREWFLIGIITVILLAKFAPSVGAKGGIFKPEITVKYIGVFIIFFNSGLSLKTEQLTRALFQVRIHVFVQTFTFVVFPLVITLLCLLLSSSPLDPRLLQGLTVLGCMPPPVSSAVILTKAVGGNEAAAVFNSAFGSFLGTIVTPALILLNVGSEGAVSSGSVVLQLSCTVVVPLVLGQIVRNMYRHRLDRRKLPTSTLGSIILLFIIYTTFCDTFSHDNINIDEISLFSVILMIVLLQGALMTLVYFVSSHPVLHLQPPDVVALMFCCTHKSLTLGIPIIKILFGDSGGVLTIPLLVYHPVQIVLGGLLVPYFRGWLAASERFRFMYPSRHRFSEFLQV